MVTRLVAATGCVRGSDPQCRRLRHHRQIAAARSGYDAAMQTRYLILAALVTGIAIIAAAAVWFAQL